MKNCLGFTLSLFTLGFASSLPIQAQESADTITEAIQGGDTQIALRYRAEYVDQDNDSREAKASTLKSRITYKTLSIEGFSATLEMDNNSIVFDDHYNDGSGTDADPEAVVADATYTEVNQAYLNYTAGHTLFRYGRQRLLLDNQRFVGGVSWRQNEQTYDAFAVINNSLPNTTITLANIYNVNTAKGGNIDGNNHQIYHVVNESIQGLKTSAYFYKLKDISDTAGIRFSGSTGISDDLTLFYTAEYAEQTSDDSAENETHYINLEAGLRLLGITGKLDYERQGSDKANAAFTTPLGTNHAFSGWADQFLFTPIIGLKDQSLTLSSTKLGPKVSLTYHQFDSDIHSVDFGNEIDLELSKKFTDNYSGSLKAAHFDARSDSGKTDTTKIWLQLQAVF